MKQKKNSNKDSKNIFITILSSFVIISGVLIGLNLFEKKKATNPSNLLVGVWQDSPSMASGWSDRYHFFKDGTFSFVTSQMKCDKILEQIDGTWKIEKGKLILTKNLILERTGGKSIKSTGSCGTKYELINYGKNTIESQKWCETNNCSVITSFEMSEIAPSDEESNYYLNTLIENKNYWKLINNPDQDAPTPIGGNVKANDYSNNN